MEGVKRPPDGMGPILALDRRSPSRCTQLYMLRDAIPVRLRPGQRLPSTACWTMNADLENPRSQAFNSWLPWLGMQDWPGSFVS